MAGFTYTLERYNGMKSRYNCPECGGKNQFARYIDGDGNYVGDHIGRCNRESKCGYHRKPKEYFEANPTISNPTRGVGFRRTTCTQPEPVKPVQYISPDVLKRTLQAYEQNTFVKYMHTIFDQLTLGKLIDAYGIGTTKDGSCIFWQVDNQGQIRTGKVIRYNEDGHRDKSKAPYFIHTKLKVDPIEQCLFGLHLLGDRPIGLVESEKTAVMMAGSLPDYTWMATGGKLNLKQVHALKGKKVVAFPDTDAFNDWTDRLTPYGFKISKALQKHVSDPNQGYDLADFLKPKQDAVTNKDRAIKVEFDFAGNLIDPILGYPVTWKEEPKTPLERMMGSHPHLKTVVERFDLEVTKTVRG
jgi:hypothetical protein